LVISVEGAPIKNEFLTGAVAFTTVAMKMKRIIIGSNWQPETKQGIEGKIVRFRLGRVRDRVRDN